MESDILPSWKRDHRWLKDDLQFEKEQYSQLKLFQDKFTFRDEPDWLHYTELMEHVTARINALKAKIIRHKRGL